MSYAITGPKLALDFGHQTALLPAVAEFIALSHRSDLRAISAPPPDRGREARSRPIARFAEEFHTLVDADGPPARPTRQPSARFSARKEGTQEKAGQDGQPHSKQGSRSNSALGQPLWNPIWYESPVKVPPAEGGGAAKEQVLSTRGDRQDQVEARNGDMLLADANFLTSLLSSLGTSAPDISSPVSGNPEAVREPNAKSSGALTSSTGKLNAGASTTGTSTTAPPDSATGWPVGAGLGAPGVSLVDVSPGNRADPAATESLPAPGMGRDRETASEGFALPAADWLTPTGPAIAPIAVSPAANLLPLVSQVRNGDSAQTKSWAPMPTAPSLLPGVAAAQQTLAGATGGPETRRVAAASLDPLAFTVLLTPGAQTRGERSKLVEELRSPPAESLVPAGVEGVLRPTTEQADGRGQGSGQGSGQRSGQMSGQMSGQVMASPKNEVADPVTLPASLVGSPSGAIDHEGNRDSGGDSRRGADDREEAGGALLGSRPASERDGSFWAPASHVPDPGAPGSGQGMAGADGAPSGSKPRLNEVPAETALERLPERLLERLTAPPREMVLTIPHQDGEGVLASIQVRDRNGAVEIAVRTPDAQLSRSLQDGLPDLVARLETYGTGASAMRGDQPGGGATDWNGAQDGQSPDGRQRQGRGDGGQDQRHQNPQDPGQPRGQPDQRVSQPHERRERQARWQASLGLATR